MPKISNMGSNFLSKLIIPLVLCALFTSCGGEKTDYTRWENYGGTKDAARYSALNQLDTNNVKNISVAWEFHTGEIDTANKTQMQCQPIIVDGIVYGATPKKNFFAVEGATGKLLWTFKPAEFIVDSTPWWGGTNRGVTYWSEKEEKRLFVTVGPFLFALNLKDGKPIESFGNKGQIDLHDGLDRDDVEKLFLTANTPGIIYKDKIIMGMRLSEGADAAPGHIRAFNVRTGKREWIFHTVPHPGEVGFETWMDKEAWRWVGGGNNWAGMSVDEKRGIVYVPTGSVTPDFYGGLREGDNLFSDCLLALDANTGKRIWHFQAVHHDMWDRDFPANPNLVTVKKDGKNVDAVAQISKQGFVYLFNRVTGEPIFPIEERPVPTDGLEGEIPSKTQPFPTKIKPYARQSFDEKDINTITTDAAERAEIVAKLRKTKRNSLFEPPSKQGTLIFPGFDGGGEWGGAAFDPTSNILYVNSNEMPWIMEMVDVEKPVLTGNPKAIAQSLYLTHCSSCHGENKKGNSDGTIPTLVGLKTKMTKPQVLEIIQKGRKMMPSMAQISKEDRERITNFLMDIEEGDPSVLEAKTAETTPSNKPEPPYIPYQMNGYNKFITKSGHAAISPPWGTLTAIDLNTGEHVWQIPLGEFDDLKKKGIPPTGAENYGGPVVTAGGLIFIGATKDEKFRAFNKKTGKLLWEYKLPAGAYSTPSIYSVNGKQYVVVACGGGKMGTKSGDSYIAFALPN
jgi:quinoprotein glucose dehydrogenase